MSIYTESDYYNALKDGFDHNSFKNEEQKRAIECVLSGKYRDIIISMATHAGKSLCFQLPRLFQRSGIVLVVSPNIGLITNQVAYLNEMRIPATCITSVTPQIVRKDMIKIFYDYEGNSHQFLYITPEMLVKGSWKVREMIEYLFEEDQISFVAVDEAHLVINLDYYRDSFKHLGEIRKQYRNVLWIALTTASYKDIQIISDSISMINPEIIKGPSDRKDIFYDVKLDTKFSKDSILELMDLDEKPENHVTKKIYASGIIYCHTNKETDLIANFLTKNRISAESFYGTKNESTLVLKRWMDGIFPVLVATEESFGVGIRRSRLQFVIHFGQPQNMRGFYQQSGRVDCVRGYSRIIYNNKNKSFDEIVRSYADTERCRHQFIANFFGDEDTKPCGNHCDNCVAKTENKSFN